MRSLFQRNKKRVIALIAGGGKLPGQIMAKLDNLGIPYNVVSLAGFGPEGYPTFQIGEIGGILDFVKSHDTTEIIFCGNVKRPSLFSLKLDSLGKKWLRLLGFKAFLGDNTLLKSIKNLLQKEGLEVISPQSILETILTPKGILTTLYPNDSDLKDIARGIYVLNAMSKADVGQAVIVQEGIVLGIEAAEGTQGLIERCDRLKLTDSQGGVLVKTAKLNQEESIDLPTIGRDTVLQAKNSRLSGIALGALKSQIIDFEETINLANENNMFVIGI